MRITLAKDPLGPERARLANEVERRLTESARLVAPDSDLSLPSQEAWRKYRAKLRKALRAPDPRTVELPTPPPEERAAGPFLTYRQIVEAFTQAEQTAILLFLVDPSLPRPRREGAANLLGTLLRAAAINQIDMSDLRFASAIGVIVDAGIVTAARMAEIQTIWRDETA